MLSQLFAGLGGGDVTLCACICVSAGKPSSGGVRTAAPVTVGVPTLGNW